AQTNQSAAKAEQERTGYIFHVCHICHDLDLLPVSLQSQYFSGLSWISSEEFAYFALKPHGYCVSPG
ncbi:hypothetical protein, partial [Enterococcus faecium]|uniref:hypothetical protein n=1 Tax=Enterococcus faecium TaxID=1352 RepID=UPI0034E935FD